MNMPLKFIFICLKLDLHYSYVIGICIAHCIICVCLKVCLNLYYVCIYLIKELFVKNNIFTPEKHKKKKIII